MAKLTIVNPVAEAESGTSTAQRFPPAPRPDTLDGKTIGLFWNAKAGGEIALARTRERLASIYPNAKFVDYFGRSGNPHAPGLAGAAG